MNVVNLLRSINVLNILLAAALIAAAQFIVLPLAGLEPKISLPAVKAVSAKHEEEKKAGHEPAAPPIDYTLIADQNLFHPERKIPTDKPSDKEKPLPKAEFVLYGTVIDGDMSLAYVDDKQSPISTPGRGKRLRVLKKGDSLSGYILKDIMPDRIVMARGEDVITVDLMNPKAKSRDLTSDMPATSPHPTTTTTPPRRQQ